MVFTSDDVSRLIKIYLDIQNKINGFYNDLSDDNISKEFFRLAQNSAGVYLMSLRMIDDSIKCSWWNNYIKDKELREEAIGEYIQEINTGLLLVYCARMEKNFRDLYKKLFTVKQEPKYISHVRNGILKKLSLEKYEALLDILFTARNTQHNLGVHSEPSKEIEWKNKKYNFIQNKKIELDYFSIAEIQKELLEMFQDFSLVKNE